MSYMSKQNDGSVQFVQFGRIAFDHNVINAIARKTERTTKQYDELRYQLAPGWNTNQGVINTFDPSSPIWSKVYQEMLDQTYARRLVEHQELCNKVKSGNKEAQNSLKCFRLAYCDKSGKVFKPDLIGNTCNGRGKEFFPSQVLRATGYTLDGEKYSAEEPDASWFSVPVLFRVFNREEERVDAQIDENRKDVGFVEPSLTDHLRYVEWRFYHGGMTASQCRVKFPGTVGQKLWYAVKLDSLWSDTCPKSLRFKDEPKRPNLSIVARMLMEPKASEYLSLSSLNNINEWTTILGRSTPDGLKKLNDKIDKDNRRAAAEGREEKDLLAPATPQDVEDFLRGKTGTKTKTLTKKEWETFSSNNVLIMQDVAQDHLNGTTSHVNFLVDNKEVYNAVHDGVKDGDGELILLAMRVMRHPLFESFSEMALEGRSFRLVEENQEETPRKKRGKKESVVPTEVVPTEVVPTEVVPTEAVPTETIPQTEEVVAPQTEHVPQDG